MKITIVGFGEVGSTIASLLNTLFNNVSFYVLDPNNEVRGRILDFAHACASKKNVLLWNDTLALEQSDFIIYCAGHSNQKGESRETVADLNKAILQQIFDTHQISDTTKVIVVTNPVEKITKWLQELLPNNLVIGTGTSLDTYRLDYLVSQKLKTPISSVKSLVLGEHGQHMVPIYSQSFVNEVVFTSIFSEEDLDQLTNDLKNAATLIRETEKATKYGVSECVRKIIKALIGLEDLTLPLSIKINSFYKNLLSTNEDVVISLPVNIINKNLSINNMHLFSEQELMALKMSLNQL